MLKIRFLVAGIIFLICALTLSGCFGGGGQPQGFGSLDGYVYVTTGNARLQVRGELQDDIQWQTWNPLPGAIITVCGKTGTSDESGYFKITSIPVGTYTVSIRASGYQELSIPGVAISKDQTTHLSYKNLCFSPKLWNFLVYLAADNNLELYAIADLNEMEEIGSTDQVNVLVLIDRHPGYDTSNGDWTGTRLYYVTKDSNTSIIKSTLLAELGERDMSDPTTLRDFIIYCQTNFPADKTCLTLWNHGGGVYPRSISGGKRNTKSSGALKNELRGICWDDTTTDPGDPWNCLTTDEVAWALAEAEKQTSRKIDVLNMDACLAQMLEVAYEWRNKTGYLVGSEAEVDANGNDYGAVLDRLTRNPSMGAKELAQALVDEYHDYYRNKDSTYSFIDLGPPFTTLITGFIKFADALNNTTDIPAVYLAKHYFTTYFDAPEIIDLYDFANELSWLSADPQVVTAARELNNAIGNAVYAKNSGQYTTDQKAYGVAILLPTYSEWSDYSDQNQYAALALSQRTAWDEFIAKFMAFDQNPVSTANDLIASITWDSGNCDLKSI